GPDSIAIVPLSDLGMPGKVERIELPGHPLPAGLAFSPNGRKAYIAFSRMNAMAVVDAATRSGVRQGNTGVAPCRVGGAEENGRIYVTNRGGRVPKAGDTTAPSSGTQVVTDAVTGSSVSGTVSVIDAETFSSREIEVGLQPSDLVLSPDGKSLLVTNSHSDS